MYLKHFLLKTGTDLLVNRTSMKKKMFYIGFISQIHCRNDEIVDNQVIQDEVCMEEVYLPASVLKLIFSRFQLLMAITANVR